VTAKKHLLLEAPVVAGVVHHVEVVATAVPASVNATAAAALATFLGKHKRV